MIPQSNPPLLYFYDAPKPSDTSRVLNMSKMRIVVCWHLLSGRESHGLGRSIFLSPSERASSLDKIHSGGVFSLSLCAALHILKHPWQRAKYVK